MCGAAWGRAEQGTGWLPQPEGEFMPLDQHTLALFEALRDGKLSRRQFARRLLALGFAGSTISVFLAACGSVAPPAAQPTPAPTARAVVPAPAPAATQAPAAPTAVAAAAAKPTAAPANDPGILASPDPNPKRGGTLRIAFGVTTSNYDLQQGAANTVLCHMYSTLVRLNLMDGLKTIVPGRRRARRGGTRRPGLHLHAAKRHPVP